MKNKNDQSKHFHQYVEQVLSHQMSLVLVTTVMFLGVLSFDARMRGLMQEAYTQGWGWLGTYLHHEHPMHLHGSLDIGRYPTISGPGPR
jgi:hypothetical protein